MVDLPMLDYQRVLQQLLGIWSLLVTSNYGLWVQNRVVEPLVEVQI